MKKLLVLTITIMSFLCVSTATAARFDLTLGWHNLIVGDYYLIDENFNNDFEYGDKIKTGLLSGSKLRAPVIPGSDPEKLINLGAFGYGAGTDSDPYTVDVFGVKTKNKFNKWVKKKSKKALKKAAKASQKAETNSNRGWKSVFYDWKEVDIWSLYYGTDGTDGNEYIETAFNNMFNGKTFKGRIGDQKFTASMQIFANTWTPTNPVPEPATAMLFGIGLLGLAGFGRKQKK